MSTHGEKHNRVAADLHLLALTWKRYMEFTRSRGRHMRHQIGCVSITTARMATLIFAPVV